MSLFHEEKYKVTVTPEIKLIPEFSAIWTRDKSANKQTAMRELAYIYFVTDHKSPYFIYSNDDRVGEVKKDLAFDPDWEPDGALIRAANKYEILMETPSVKSLKAIKESLLTSTKVIKLMQRNIEDMMNSAIDSSEDDESNTDLIDRLSNSIDRLLGLSSKLPKAVATIEELEEKVKKEQSNERKIKGGGTTTYFED